MNNLIRKNKYIITAIAIALVLSIGLSFCAWDKNSIKNLSIDGGVSDYKPYTLVEDNDNSETASVGDIVTYGNYYQESSDEIKSPLRWIVVDIRLENKKNIMYLLSEKSLAFGSFNSSKYGFDDNGDYLGDKHSYYDQCYNESTLRSWLNSSVRMDGGIGFPNSDSDKNVVFKGFYDEAFSKSEKNIIVPRMIGGASGATRQGKDVVKYADLPNEKVWVPSFTEMYGRVLVSGMGYYESFESLEVKDSSLDKQFEYFKEKDASAYIAKSTLFSTTLQSNGLANYCRPYLRHARNNNVYTFASENVGYWLRSPSPADSVVSIKIFTNGTGEFTYGAHGNQYGVRPAICLEK